ncbi:MAG: hypothetical protein J6P05_02105 [Lachnospiraceae bacterium]|nr:hypothetical protein [Lachnospiraceae bacterium]
MRLHDDSNIDEQFNGLLDEPEIEKKRPTLRSRRTRRRVRRSILIRLIPLFAGIFLILIIGVIANFVWSFITRGSRTQADLDEIYGSSDSSAGILYNGKLLEDTALILQDDPYLSLDFVMSSLNDWFYYSEKDGLLLYTLPDGTKEWKDSADSAFSIINGKPYISLELAREYSDADIEYVEEDPHRVIIWNEWGEATWAHLTQDRALRAEESAESDMIEPLKKNSALRILSANNIWSTVMTEDGFTGFMENKYLDDFYTTEESPDSSAPAIDFPSLKIDGKVLYGWHQVMGKSGNSSIQNILSSGAKINVIGPTWYPLSDTEGNFADYSSSEYVNTAHNAGLKVWPTVDNFNYEGFLPGGGLQEVLSDTGKRRKLSEALVSSVLSCGADGLNIDFESMNSETEPHFKQFLKETSVLCHNSNLFLSVDNYVPTISTLHYNRTVQGKVCDYVIIMGYDETVASSSIAGPVASIDYVQYGIDETIAEVPAEKVVNGLPFYTRVWITDSNGALSCKTLDMASAIEYARSRNASMTWDDTEGCYYAEGSVGDGTNSTFKVWLEDSDSLGIKLNLMQHSGLAGAAFWKLGFDMPSVWDIVNLYASGQDIPVGS